MYSDVAYIQCTFHVILLKVLYQLPDLPDLQFLITQNTKKWVRPVVHDNIH